MLLARESVNSGLHFDLAKLEAEIKELSTQSEREDFWNDRNQALEVINKLNADRTLFDSFNHISSTYNDLV